MMVPESRSALVALWVPRGLVQRVVQHALGWILMKEGDWMGRAPGCPGKGAVKG
jgi:hypothetical protein